MLHDKKSQSHNSKDYILLTAKKLRKKKNNKIRRNRCFLEFFILLYYIL